MSLASNRSRRPNAGSKMNEMVNSNTETDDFYKQTYGGFIEEEEDNEYQPEESDDDVVDSDFDIDENDEPVEEDEEPQTKRTRRVVTKSYKEPPKEKVQIKKAPSTPKKQPVTVKESEKIENLTGVKSVRASTKLKSEETALRVKLDSEARKKAAAKKKNFKNHASWRKLTQEELLKEAKLTEQINLKSLEKYRKLELEKAQKSKVVKEVDREDRIIYRSTSMPLIESTENGEVKETDKRFSRNFITFTDEETFSKYFKKNVKPPVPVTTPVCPISGLKARYYDPVIQMPFASGYTFKALREAYCQQLELLGDPKQPDVAEWLAWRKKTNLI
ncbi:vacuolar protein sorting-associated protein 72 homolog [Panonychus citri]|uniref:vacuolar protein sorting-associated protein 72 homolog n=1 Tax=Panonychus citri TaxID=50023 RepID=UPI00230805DF|nr:vacuolar protein sorting-associated protein 72 homolog [Panonychus citri]